MEEVLLRGWEVVRDAHVAMAHPTEINSAHLFNGFVVTVTAFCILFVFDKLFARVFVRRYFALHVFANVVITWLTIREACGALLNPCSSAIPLPGSACSSIFVGWVYALHIYHPIFFKTGLMDWVHHVPVYILNTRACAWHSPARPVSKESGTIAGCANITG